MGVSVLESILEHLRAIGIVATVPFHTKEDHHMAASNEWTEWHLTPHGWVRGSEKDDFKGLTRRDEPDDCVMTAKHSEYAGSVHSRLEKTDETIWKDSDVDLVESLLNQYGPAPRHL